MENKSSNVPRRLLWHGVFLLLLGLLTGFLVPALRNPRMGVSAHLEALMNGFFLLILGIIWRELRFSALAATATFRIALFGTYMNWAFTLLGGVLGTSRLTPIAGAGFTGPAWQETLVAAGLVPLTMAMVVCSVLVLFGLRGSPRE
jgi:(hydroxyamino)benzene mutase